MLPLHHDIPVGATGFEPAVSCSQSRRADQATPRPESPGPCHLPDLDRIQRQAQPTLVPLTRKPGHAARTYTCCPLWSSQFTSPQFPEESAGARIRTLTGGFGDRRACRYTTPTNVQLERNRPLEVPGGPGAGSSDLRSVLPDPCPLERGQTIPIRCGHRATQVTGSLRRFGDPQHHLLHVLELRAGPYGLTTLNFGPCSYLAP